MPDFNPSQIDDSESVYEDSLEWLSTLSSRDDARSIAMDIQSHRNIGQGALKSCLKLPITNMPIDFPARVFLEHLFELTQIRLERLHPFTADRQQPVLISIINSTLQSVKDSMQPHQMKLLQSYNHSVRRSPKRRNYSSVSTSEQGRSVGISWGILSVLTYVFIALTPSVLGCRLLLLQIPTKIAACLRHPK